MLKVEEKIVSYIMEKKVYVVFGLFILMSLAIRVFVRDCTNGDIENYLLPWYEQIKANGGLFGGLSKPVYAANGEICNYTFAYQFLIAVMTSLPINPVYAYKILSVIFDYLLIGAIFNLVSLVSEKTNKGNLVILFCLVLIHPIIFMNSAMWGQCDSIYTFWIAVSIICLVKEKYIKAFIFYGLAFAFKLQAIFFLPFLLFYYVYKKRYSFLYFFIIPAVVVCTGIPAFVQGRSVMEAFRIYSGNTSLYTRLAMGYPSFWTIISDGVKTEGYYSLKLVAIAVTICILAAHMYYWIDKKADLSSKNMLYMAFILAYTTVLFLPGMHERYGYLYEVLALVILFLNLKTMRCYIGLFLISIAMYGSAIYGTAYNMVILSIANLLIYIYYLKVINEEIVRG